MAIKLSVEWNSNQNYNEISPHTMIKMSTNNKCWRSYREQETFLHCRLECKSVKSLWRTVWRLLKIKIELLYDPTIPFLVIYPERAMVRRIHAPQDSLQYYLRKPRHGSNLSPCWQMNGWRRCGIFI